MDNIDASGGTIVGVSLGSPRVLRLVKKRSENRKVGGEGNKGTDAKDSRIEGFDSQHSHGFDIYLPSGSVYVQRDSVRYDYEHSILGYDDPVYDEFERGLKGENEGNADTEKGKVRRGHRVSLMVRVSEISLVQSGVR